MNETNKIKEQYEKNTTFKKKILKNAKDFFNEKITLEEYYLKNETALKKIKV